MNGRTIAALLAAVSLGGVLPGAALAWGPDGHRLIGTLAVRNLPDEVPAFVRTPAAAAEIGTLATEPDRWRGSGPTHDGERDAAHFVHALDDLTVMAGPRLAALPPTREAYDTALRAAGSTQYAAGYLPYAIVDGWQQLRTDFAYWRIAAAGERLAASADDRAWFAADRALREVLTLRDFGVWAHYVGDASQPLHSSVHYDVWGAFPNPEGFSQAKGLHWRFEGPFVAANVAARDVAPLLAPYRDCACAIEERTSAYLIASQAFVAPLFRLEKRHAFEGLNAEGRAFAAQRIAAGASELRDMALDAWRSSAGATLLYPPVAVKDAEAGNPAALHAVRGAD
ncbi:MAG TPA: hypothetical protein VNU97_02675 [Rhizomicrobium sp.]|jgi:hypothetical protein|nr:hypothetical protein [Rhizomicrobium sp.]